MILKTDTEVWKDIKGFEGKYQISDKGRVKSLTRIVKFMRLFKPSQRTVYERIMKPKYNPNGYLRIDFSRKIYSIHRLVAKAFISNPYNKPQINHKDFNRSNNNVENLEWVTPQENTDHAMKYGNYNYKLKKNEAILIRKLYKKGKRGYGCYVLAKRFNVKPTCIFNIVNRNTYKDI